MLIDKDNIKPVMTGEKWVSIGIDMGQKKWVACALDYTSGKSSCATFSGGNYDQQCYAWIYDKYTSNGYDVSVTYEAGRSGFTPARKMMEICESIVTIIPVNKLQIFSCGKQVKTDRVDAKLLSLLDPRIKKGLPSVWIPDVKTEELRTAQKEKKRIEKSIARENNIILSVLERFEVIDRVTHHMSCSEWKKYLKKIHKSGTLPDTEMHCICNRLECIKLYEGQLRRWNKRLNRLEEERRKEAAENGDYTVADKLRQFMGIGDEIARTYDWQIGDMFRFQNGRKFSSYFGLTPTPYASGKKQHEQGISKKGNPELRRLAIQLAWLWVQYQPNSALTKKYAHILCSQKKGKKNARSRKTTIVALSRQLMVALWKYITAGIPPEGAVMNRPLPALQK